jgi:GNAT superfamily N-acetyltransferase
MEVRPALAADVAPLAAGLAGLDLMKRYGRGEAKLAADLAQAVSAGDGLLLAVEAGRPVGMTWFLRQGTLGLGGYLKLMAVLPGAQSRGLGAGLLAATEGTLARTTGHGFLLCSDFNGPAQAFYQRHGWTRVGALPGLVLPDVAELIYWKRLRPR